jgi:serine protease Do
MAIMPFASHNYLALAEESATTKTTSSDFPGSFADLVEELLPSVVNISSTQKAVTARDFPDMPHFPPGSPFEDFFEEFMDKRGHGIPSMPPASLGSGFIIDAEEGYIVTNSHVVEETEDVRVTFYDDETIEAEIIGRDEKTDLVILKVETDKKLTAVEFGESKILRVGDWIIAIGNPFGLGGTVTAGIISAQKRNINAGPYDDFIQTDASINRGNSGGPMFNMDGKVIGINTAIFSPSGGSVGIGFAIPSDLAKPVIAQLIEYGHTRRGWLGVRIQSVTEEIADSLGLDEAGGALVASVTKTGPAEKAGLEPGDIIMEFDGQKITEMRGLPRIIAETPIGKKSSLIYWRNGSKKETSVVIGELEKAEEEGLITTGSNKSDSSKSSKDGLEIEAVGLTLGEISDDDRNIFSIPYDIEGVLVRKVKDLSIAAEKGIMQGDVVMEINQQAVTDPEEAGSIIEKAEAAGRNSVLLLINREGDSFFEALRLKRD